jgi:RHS repeat-associated protein
MSRELDRWRMVQKLNSQNARGLRVTQRSYYHARYYNPSAGRFISEDPVGFGGGLDFYSYVFNRSVQLTDPIGMSPQDIKRILEACRKCTKQLSDEGKRSPGTGILNGWWNNLVNGFSLGNKYNGCLPQAQRVQPCLENPAQPLDDSWSFGIVPAWGGSHWVVRAWNNNNPSEPYVICDPWLNKGSTAPHPLTYGTGGSW